jgi:hypothetical protein
MNEKQGTKYCEDAEGQAALLQVGQIIYADQGRWKFWLGKSPVTVQRGT